MRINTLIVEDEMASRKLLEELIGAYCPELKIIGAVTSVEEAVKVIKESKPELVLLDIELPREDGLSLFKYFERADFKTIFTTSYDEYAVEAFRHSAVDYLLKPINGEELSCAVNKVRSKTPGQSASALATLQERYATKTEKVGIATMSGYEFYKVKEIVRAEADGRYTEIHLVNGRKILSTKNIGEYEKILTPLGFFRLHRSHLINLIYVKKYQRGNMPLLELDDGSIVPVAGRKKEGLLAHLKIS